MFLLDLTHTSHTQARTGIQRVCRTLYSYLGANAIPVTHDPYRRAWRTLQDWEYLNLGNTLAASKKRGAKWPLSARLSGKFARLLNRPAPEIPEASHLIVPELFSPGVAAALPALFAKVTGPRVALFYDAIALKFPEYSPPKTVARMPSYLRELAQFDAIAADSADARDTLVDYWKWLGLANPPPVVAHPLGIDLCQPIVDNPPATARPTLLFVSSIEGRKNHLALLEACESLWASGRDFELRLIGLAQQQTGRAALDRITALQAAGRPLRYDGPVDETTLNAAYAACAFTVYPSLIEGFGLPVLESLNHGKPCICSGRGALGESAHDGGCLALDSVDAASLARAIDTLLTRPDELARLRREAAQRTFRTWADYARDLTAWIETIRRR